MLELTDKEMIRAYDELERAMHELRNNLGKRVGLSDPEAINAWQTRARDTKEKRSSNIEEKALQLAVAAERIRERTYAGVRVTEVAPICEAKTDRQGAHTERVEPVATLSNIEKKSNGENRRVKIEEVKMEPGNRSATTKSERKVKTEKIETSDDSRKSRRRDQKSGSDMNTGKTRDTSSAEEYSGKDEHKETLEGHRRKSGERSKKYKGESDSDGEERKTKHRGKGGERKGKYKTVKIRKLDFATDESSEEETNPTKRNRKRQAESESEHTMSTSNTDQTMQTLYHDINRTAGFASPGKSSIHRELAAIDASIDALNDSNLRMRVRDKEPKNLDHALLIALPAEANTEAKQNATQEEQIMRGKEYKARVVQNATQSSAGSSNASVDSINNRCDKICEMLETMFKSSITDGATAVAAAVSTTASVQSTMPARANVTCFKCGNLGHYATACPEQASSGNIIDGRGPRCYSCQGYGHIAWSCPKADKKEGDSKSAENVRGVKGPDTRQMKDHPVYLEAYMGKRAVNFLVDTGCERSVAPKRRTGDEILEPAECRLFAANGTVMNVVGEVTMNIRIGDLILPTRFVVSDNITEPMLGLEWLCCNRMIWDFAKDILLVIGVVFPLIPGERSGMCRSVVATEQVIVPARSQAFVPGRVEMNRMSSDSNGGVWTTEVSELKNGVNVALSDTARTVGRPTNTSAQL